MSHPKKQPSVEKKSETQREKDKDFTALSAEEKEATLTHLLSSGQHADFVRNLLSIWK